MPRHTPPLFACALIVMLCGALQPAAAIPIDGSDLMVEYAAGSGDNSTYFIVDFGGAPSGDQGTYAFEYRWNPGELITAAAALAELDSAGAFVSDTTYYGTMLGESIDGFSYLGDSHVPGFDDPSWYYWWGDYSAAGGGSVAWSEAEYGISGLVPNALFTAIVDTRYIEANGFEGFYSDTYFNAAQPPRTEPALPLSATMVPEPSALLLLVVAAACTWLLRGRLFAQGS